MTKPTCTSTAGQGYVTKGAILYKNWNDDTIVLATKVDISNRIFEGIVLWSDSNNTSKAGANNVGKNVIYNMDDFELIQSSIISIRM